jgi:multisubunit Na+/H+ antiporter MnhF subunit
MGMKNVGGTPGGTGTFLLGLIMGIAGGYLLFNQVQVHGGYWSWGGFGGAGRSFGITLLPLLFGIGILFVNGKSIVGRLLTFGGALVIVVGVIANLDIQFEQTSLWNTLIMLVLLVGGIGMIVRSVRPMMKEADRPGAAD